MFKTRFSTTVIAVTIAAGSLSLAPTAAAAYAEDCVHGPAVTASSEAPHIWDQGADSQLTPHSEATDLRAGWIGVSEKGFTANIQVTDMSVPPVSSRYIFIYLLDGETRYVDARLYPGVTWGYEAGVWHPNGPTTWVVERATTGSVDTAAGVISIDIPADFLPAASTDGSEVSLVLGQMQAHLRAYPVGLRISNDDATWTCKAVLHEATATTGEG